MKNIKRYEQMKNKLKSVRAQPVRPSSGFCERDRLYDQDLFLAMKLQREEYEEGEDKEGRLKTSRSSIVMLYV